MRGEEIVACHLRAAHIGRMSRSLPNPEFPERSRALLRGLTCVRPRDKLGLVSCPPPGSTKRYVASGSIAAATSDSRTSAPILMHKADALFTSPDWIYEPMWDSFWAIATVRDGAVRLISRNGHSFTNSFGPSPTRCAGFLISIVLDGEIMVTDDHRHPDFERLQQRLRLRGGTLLGHL
jgi:hypothetical protein